MIYTILFSKIEIKKPLKWLRAGFLPFFRNWKGKSPSQQVSHFSGFYFEEPLYRRERITVLQRFQVKYGSSPVTMGNILSYNS